MLPPQLVAVNRCRSCSGRTFVPGDGPVPCRILFVGEAPAKWEERYRRPFAGDTGKEVDYYYLPAAGLSRPECRFTNVRHCAESGYVNPTPEQALDCASLHLARELVEVQPEVVVLLGAVACSLLPGSIDLEMEHGIPRLATLLGWTGIVVPFYHPSAGLHEQSFMIPMLEDWSRLPRVLEDPAGMVPVNTHPQPDYHLIEHVGRLQEALTNPRRDHLGRPLIGVDTEFIPEPHPDGRGGMFASRVYYVSFSVRPGSGCLIQASNRAVLDELAGWLRATTPLVFLHHALADLDPLEQAGITGFEYRDTMVGSYILGNFPQGLKVLAYRLFGVSMQSFEDLVLPYSREVVLSWLSQASLAINSLAYAVQHPKTKRGKPKLVSNKLAPEHVRSAAAKAGKLLTEMLTKGSDPWKRWEGWHEPERVILTELAGSPLPQPSIAHVPTEKAIRYACADADLTLRLGLRQPSLFAGLRRSTR